MSITGPILYTASRGNHNGKNCFSRVSPIASIPLEVLLGSNDRHVMFYQGDAQAHGQNVHNREIHLLTNCRVCLP